MVEMFMKFVSETIIRAIDECVRPPA